MSAQDTGRMRRIGEIYDFDGRLEELRAIRMARRDARCRAYGWLPTVTCAECGDTGYPPDGNGKPCIACSVGRARQRELDNDAAWTRIVPKRFREFSLESHPQRGLARKVRDEWLGAVEIISTVGGMGFPPRVDRGPNLVLIGTTGRGKTGLAFGALRALHRMDVTVKWGTVPDLLAGLRPNDAGEGPDFSLRSLQRTNVLLMDDLGVEKMSEWAAEQLYAIVNARYEAELPTIVTSNLSVDGLEAAVGTRIMSRLLERAVVLPVTGPDLREVR